MMRPVFAWCFLSPDDSSVSRGNRDSCSSGLTPTPVMPSTGSERLATGRRQPGRSLRGSGRCRPRFSASRRCRATPLPAPARPVRNYFRPRHDCRCRRKGGGALSGIFRSQHTQSQHACGLCAAAEAACPPSTKEAVSPRDKNASIF